MSQSKKILLLGGSDQQVVAIDTARNLGYETVLCDYLPDNPGKHHADKFYQTSTTDKEGVLAVAVQEGVDGIIAYASDPAAPTAAYVADQLGLPGVPYAVACAFCEKHRFRRFLEEHGFAVPQSVALHAGMCSNADIPSCMKYPLIVKPTDSSGSKGVAVVATPEELDKAFEEARQFSRNGILVVEEYIERDHPHVIEAEIFVADGEVASWGLIDSIRDAGSNPLLPAAYSYPLTLSDSRKELVKKQIERLVKASSVQYGAFNIEMIIDADDELFFLDAGPRNGGNRLPEFISSATGQDVISASIRAAMGDYGSLSLDAEEGEESFWGLVVLHASHAGRLRGIAYSPAAEPFLQKEFLQVEYGDKVNSFEKCTDLLGLAFFKFEAKDELDDVMMNLHEHVNVIVEEDPGLGVR